MNAAPLVLLHGWGLTPAIWGSLRAALPPEIAVHTPSLPGHDDSPAPDSRHIEDWSDVLAPYIPEGSVLCGWSLGGMIALDLARRHPDKVSRLVLIGASPRFIAGEGHNGWPHGLPRTTVQGFIDSFSVAPEATLKRFIALQTLGDARRRMVGPALTESLASLDNGRIAGLSRALGVLAECDLRSDAAAVRQHVTLIHGAGDALMPVGAAQWLAGHLPSARVALMQDCGHAPFLSCPDECARQLLDAHD